MKYFVVEPLEEGGFQVWRVGLTLLGPCEPPDEDGVVVTPGGAQYTWRWTPVGDPLGSHDEAKIEAYRRWYSIKDEPCN